MPTTPAPPADVSPRPGPDAAEPPVSSPPRSSSWALPALVALLTLATIELVRASGPLLDMAFAHGVTAAAGAALLTYGLPGPIAFALVVLGRRAGPLGPVVIGAVALALARMLVQGLEAGPRFGVGLATVALALAVLTLAVAALAARPGGGGVTARCVALGAAASVGLQLALGTWDAPWRPGVLGWAVAGVLALALATLAVLARRTPTPEPPRRTGRLWTLGPVLALTAMSLANPAFAASQAATPLWVVGAALGAALLLAASDAWGRLSRRSGRWVPWLGVAALGLLTTGVMVATGAGALVMLVALAPVVTTTLARAVEPSRASPVPAPAAAPSRMMLAATLAGLTTILPLLVYQLDYDVPLGFPNWLVIVATAVALGLGAVRRDPGPEAAPVTPPVAATPDRGSVDRRAPRLWAVLAVAVAFVVAGTAVAGLRALSTAERVGEATRAADLAGGAEGGSLTLVNWNVHYGVDPAGSVDLEALATTIAAHDPDVVTLQEVSRGWVMGGGADMVTWLAQRLEMRMSFAPAADRQFGNAILSRLPQEDVAVLALPYGDGPQRRSALSVDLRLPDGPLRVTSIHVQHREVNTPTRLAQIRALLEAEGESPRAVVAGDFNAEPGWEEIALLTGDAGFVSAQDVAGDPTALTSPSLDPQHRIDWVFGRGVTFMSSEVLTDALASDHLPLVVTLRPSP